MSFPPYQPHDEDPYAAPKEQSGVPRGDAKGGRGRTFASCLLAASMPFVGVVIGLMVAGGVASQAADDIATQDGQAPCGLFTIPFLFMGSVGGFLGGLVAGIVIALVALSRAVSPETDGSPES